MNKNVHVSFNALDDLYDNMIDISTLIYSFIDRKELCIHNALQKVQFIVDRYYSLKNDAFNALRETEEEFESKKKENMDLVEHFSYSVNEARAKYLQINDEYNEVKAVQYEFNLSCNSYKRELQLIASYCQTIAVKGTTFIEKFKEMLKLSQKAITEDYSIIEASHLKSSMGSEKLYSEIEIIKSIDSSLKDGLKTTFNREATIAAEQKRKHNLPQLTTATGQIKGKWDDDMYIFHDDYIPVKYNFQKQTIKVIKQNLYNEFNIKFEGIKYTEGVADFSSISVAHIPMDSFITAKIGIANSKYDNLSESARLKLLQDVFSPKNERKKNFKLADKILSKSNYEISGLEKGSDYRQIRSWRKKNKFSWHEQFSDGFYLVPSIIHGNLTHTGAVAISKNAITTIVEHRELTKNSPENFMLSEKDAIISNSEI